MKNTIRRWAMTLPAALVVCLVVLAIAGPAELAFSSPAESARSASLSQGSTAGGFNGPFGFGTPATEEEIAAWDIDVRPDGTGLPRRKWHGR